MKPFEMIRILVVVMYILSPSLSSAVPPEDKINLRHLTIEDGLSQSSVFAILQDNRGFRWFAMPNVFITGHGDIPMSVKAMKTGAIDFLTKPFDDNDLLDAVKEALRQDTVIRREFNERQNILQRVKSLTPSEYEILTYVITGMLNKQIAYTLEISEKQ